MKSNQPISGMVSPILYFVAAAFWVVALVIGGGPLLFWAALTCLASGVFLLAWGSSWVTRPLVKASAVFGLVLTLYQTYIGLTLIGTGLDPVAAITGGAFGAMAVIYVYLLLFARAREQE